MENPPARILIIDTAWMGDVVFTTSLIGAARNLWPESEVHVLVAPRGEAIVQYHPQVSRVWVYDKHSSQKSLASMRNLSRELQHQNYDLILNAHPSFRSRLLTRLIRPKTSVGYQGFGSRFCFTHTVRNDLAVEPDHVERRINLLRALGVEAKATSLQVGLDPSAVKWADDFLRQNGVRHSSVLCLICGSAWKTKQWTAEGFAEVGRRWHESTSGHVLLFGGNAERPSIESIAKTIGVPAISVIAEPITRVAALLSKCSAAVGNDTGVSFLAIASGCPRVIILYGSTQVNYAFPAPHKAITAGVPCCLPRTGHGANRCKWSEEPWCMGQIATDTVASAVPNTPSDPAKMR